MNRGKKKIPHQREERRAPERGDALRGDEVVVDGHVDAAGNGDSDGRYIDESGTPIETPKRGPKIIEIKQIDLENLKAGTSIGGIPMASVGGDVDDSGACGRRVNEAKYKIIDNISLMETDSDAECRGADAVVGNSQRDSVSLVEESGRSGRKRDRSPFGSFDDSRLTPGQRRIIREKVKDIHLYPSSKIGMNTLEWLEELEIYRSNSKNLQGSTSGNMKVNIRLVRDGVEELARRACATGESELQRRKFLDTKKELEKIQEHNSRLKEELEEALRGRDKLRELASDVNRGRGVSDSGRDDADRLLGASPMNLNRSGRSRVENDEMAYGRFAGRRTVQEYNSKIKKRRNTDESDLSIVDLAERLVRRIGLGVRGAVVGGARSGGGPRNGDGLADGVFAAADVGGERFGRNDARGLAHLQDGGESVTRRGGGSAARRVNDGAGRVGAATYDVGVRGARDAVGGFAMGIPSGVGGGTSIISIVCEEGGPSYASILRRAKVEIKTSELGISGTRVRRAVSGGVLLEIFDDNEGRKAASLMDKLKEIMNDSRIRITRPLRLESVRVSDLDDSITERDIKEALADACGVRQSEFKIGPFRIARNGLNTAVVTCDVAVAERLHQMKDLSIGWSLVRLELLPARKVRCFKCLAVGHTSHRCPSRVDRSGACFNCGNVGHRADACEELPACPVCLERGFPYYHRAGDARCPPYPPGPLKNLRGSPKNVRSRDKEVDSEETPGEGNLSDDMISGDVNDRRKSTERESLRPDWMQNGRR